MNIQVLNRGLATRFHIDEPWVCISISTKSTEPVEFMFPQNMQDVLRLAFADQDFPESKREIFEESMKLTGRTLFNRDMAGQILDFYQQHSTKVVLIHCDAGQCRSPAVAAALSKIFTGDDFQWFKPPYTPNSSVYRVIMEVASQRGLLGS